MMLSAPAAAPSARPIRARARRPVAAWLGLSLAAVTAACASAPSAVPSAAPAATGTSGPAPAPAAAPAKAEPGAILVWSGPLGEGLPAPLRQALSPRLQLPAGGALSAAAKAVVEGRRSFTEMRCSDALPKLTAAGEAVLGEVALPEARPLLGELYGLVLLCADRVGDAGRAEQASAALAAMQAPVPSDVALVLARYPSPRRFGPPRPPVHIESEPPGAVVLRDLIPIGVTPLDVAGGVPEQDFVDIELPGFRKLHRSLASGQQIILTLRPEDRLSVLFDRAALFEAGSDGQGAVLRAIADSPAAAVLASRRVLVLAPRQQGGAPAAGEVLKGRVYDLDRRAWAGPIAEVAAGPAATQVQGMVALVDGAGSGKPAGGGGPAPAAAVAAKAPPAKPGFKLPFSNTKWYTWVVAGGVAALIAGLLIAEKVSPEKVTISATH